MSAVRGDVVVEWMERDTPRGRDSRGPWCRALAAAAPLGKCSCCRRAFTCYPPGGYPQRQYQLDVVADVVAGVALGSEPTAQVAAMVTASPTSESVGESATVTTSSESAGAYFAITSDVR